MPEGPILVDIHAEATSEKLAMGWYLNGRVAAVLGTHTHVPTADTRMLPGGTAYVSDAGMCGTRDSVLGFEISASQRMFLSGLPTRLPVAEKTDIVVLNSVLIDIDAATGHACSIQRLDMEHTLAG
jgi:calcineurin-like phosphoesterase